MQLNTAHPSLQILAPILTKRPDLAEYDPKV